MAKSNFYAVAAGRKTGVFRTWDDCKKQVDGYPGAIFKKFLSEKEARAFISMKTGGMRGLNPAQKKKVKKENEIIKSKAEGYGIRYELYTDGSCLGNPGPGGWCAVIRRGVDEQEVFGSECCSTNNRMELTAAVEGLKKIPKGCSVLLVSDSNYLLNAFRRGWLKNWKKNGWKTRDGGDVKNQYLWIALDELMTGRYIEFKWVKGHTGNLYNERCDSIANEMAQRARDGVE